MCLLVWMLFVCFDLDEFIDHLNMVVVGKREVSWLAGRLSPAFKALSKYSHNAVDQRLVSHLRRQRSKANGALSFHEGLE